jgi:hypothetical protein
MQRVFALLVGLLLPANAPALKQADVRPAAKLIHRSERSCGYSCAQEVAIDLGGIHANQPDDRVAVRFCSKQSLPLALSTAAAAYGYVTSELSDIYNYTPQRILILRSEDCLGPNPAVTATEFWVIPQGAAPPASVESVSSKQVHSEAIGRKNLSVEGSRDYRTAVRELIAKLRARPEAVGVVLGNYYNRPSPAMRRRLREVRGLLRQSRLPQDRYFVRLAPWTGEYRINPPETEPKYPSVSIVEISRDRAR